MGSSREEAMRTSEKIGVKGVLVRGSATGFAQEILAGPHRMTADEPKSAGGTDTGTLALRTSASRLGSLHFDDGGDVRSAERMAARGA